MSSWASQVHAFHQPVCHRLSWLHLWSVPHVHSSGAFSPSKWGPYPQFQAAQVAHWTWWWKRLSAWHCRSVWSLPFHSAADVGGLAGQWPSLTGMEHCASHKRAVHAATCLETKGTRKVQGVPQSQTAALPRHQEEEETDKTNQAQIKNKTKKKTYEKH